MRQAEKAHGNDDSSVRPLVQRKMYRIRRQRQLLSFPLYRLVQTEVCNISGTSYHKAICSTRMFPHPFRLHAHWHRRVAFLFYAHMLIRSAHAHIRIMHSRLYGFLHGYIYGSAHAYIRKCTSAYTLRRKTKKKTRKTKFSNFHENLNFLIFVKYENLHKLSKNNCFIIKM